MSKFKGELRQLSINSLHENPNNIRQGYDSAKLEFLAHQIKYFGVMSPLLVYPHPDIEGDYMIREGNHRYLAALKVSETELPCIVIPATDRDDVKDLDAMMSTGQSHTNLTGAEVTAGIQRYFDLGQDVMTIGKKTKRSRTEVATLAKLAQKPEVAKLVEAKDLDLIQAQQIMDVEAETGDTSIMESVVESASSTYRMNQQDLDRLIAQKKAEARGEKLRQDLVEAGASVISYEELGTSSLWQFVKGDLSVEEHVAAGHKFNIRLEHVSWYEKVSRSTQKLSDEEKHRNERLRFLNSMLPSATEARREFVISKIQDKKGIEDRNARGLLISMIIQRGVRRPGDAGAVAVGDAIQMPYPQRSEDQDYSDLLDARAQWTKEVQKALLRLTLPQLALLLAYAPVADVDDKLRKTNWYMRDSYDKEARWEPLALWTQQLIDFAGYVPSEEESEIIRIAQETRMHESNDVQLHTATCSHCNQEVIADDRWDGLCAECMPAVDGEVA